MVLASTWLTNNVIFVNITFWVGIELQQQIYSTALLVGYLSELLLKQPNLG